MDVRKDDPASRLEEEVRELRAILDGIDETTAMLPHLWEGEAADLARGRYNRIKPEIDAAAEKLRALCSAEEEKFKKERDPDGGAVTLADFTL